jgi:hypothetical protein
MTSPFKLQFHGWLSESGTKLLPVNFQLGEGPL